MSRPVAAMLLTAVLAIPASVRAQEPLVVQRDAAAALAAFTQPAVLDMRQIDVSAPIAPPPRPAASGSSRLLASLLVSTVVVQALDVHSTYQALGRGAVEANPVMAPLAGHKAAFVASKAAVAAATVLAARQVAKRNKVAAVVTLVAINSAYAFVIDHNYRVARGLR